MSVTAAVAEGLRRVARARVLVAGVWLVNIAVTLPFALVLRDALSEHLGDSLAADAAVNGANFDWWNEFLAQASGLGQTFVPSILGFAGVLKNVGSVADGGALPGAVALIVAANTLMSMFLLGGVLDRLARDRSIGAHGFFAASGVFFFRFLRLGAVALIVYGALFGTLHPWLFDDLYGEWSRNLSVERSAFAIRVALYVAFGALVAAVNVVFDYAKIRMVVEDRRSAFGALSAALRFIRRHRGSTIALYLVNTLLFALVAFIYFVVAPGAGGGGAAVWLGFALGQAYIVARIVVRLTFAASQTALFQSRLAHAGYVARPVPRWPDAPTAEAL